MAYGFEIYKVDGSLMLNLDNRLPRIIQSTTISIGNPGASQTIYIPGYVDDGTWGLMFLIPNNIAPTLTKYSGYIVLTQNYGASTSGTLLVYRT